LLDLPYTLSDPLTLAVTLDKAMARRIVSPEIPVARAVLVEEERDQQNLADLDFPVVAKPNDEGSSKGIRRGSLCRNVAEAVFECRRLGVEYACPVLVEEYLPGTEVTVAVCGNGKSRRVLGMMEIAPTVEAPEPFLYSIEMKREWRTRVRYYIPPRLSPAIIETLIAYAVSACCLLGCRDLARIDFRLDREGRPRFLECNPLPGLDPENSDIVILTRRTLTYQNLVQGILQEAARRHGMIAFSPAKWSDL
jgi:D-alanine-D-alanine ligase